MITNQQQEFREIFSLLIFKEPYSYIFSLHKQKPVLILY